MSVSEHEFLKHAYLLSPAPQKSFSTLMVSWKNANKNFQLKECITNFELFFAEKIFSFQYVLKREETCNQKLLNSLGGTAVCDLNLLYLGSKLNANTWLTTCQPWERIRIVFLQFSSKLLKFFLVKTGINRHFLTLLQISCG